MPTRLNNSTQPEYSKRQTEECPPPKDSGTEEYRHILFVEAVRNIQFRNSILKKNQNPSSEETKKHINRSISDLLTKQERDFFLK